MLSEQVFKFCESKLYEIYKKEGGNISYEQGKIRKSSVLDSLI